MPTADCHRWDDCDVDHPMEKVERRRIIGEHAMISHITLDAGCDVPTHAHPNEQFACVLSGRVRFGVGADDAPDRFDRTLGPGEVLYVPANVPHSAFAEERSVLLDVFSPPSATTGVDRA